MKLSTTTRRALRWSPLALSGLLLLGGGGALGLSLAGQDADREAVQSLVEERQADEAAAQESFDAALEALVADASQARPSRVSADSEAGAKAIADALSGAPEDGLAPLDGLKAAGDPSVAAVGVSGVRYSYAATVALSDGRVALVTWTTEPDGSREGVSAHLPGDAPSLSEPPADEKKDDGGEEAG